MKSMKVTFLSEKSLFRGHIMKIQTNQNYSYSLDHRACFEWTGTQAVTLLLIVRYTDKDLWSLPIQN